MDVVVGVDLGGTKIAASWVNRDGGAGTVVSVPTPAHDGPGVILDAVATLVQQAMEGDDQILLRAVGIGTAGVVDVAAGTIVSATDALTGWAGTDVAAGVQARLAHQRDFRLLPVHVETTWMLMRPVRCGSARLRELRRRCWLRSGLVWGARW